MSRSVKKAISSKAPSIIVSANKKKAPPSDAFVKAFYENVMPSDMALFSADERACMAASIWGLAAARFPGEVVLRIFNPSKESQGWGVDHTVIEIVNDDMPFLVDSVTGILQKKGLAVHIVIHPIIQMVRDARGKAVGVSSGEAGEAREESFIHIQIDRCSDGAELRSLEDEIRATLADVRASVQDWGAMLSRVQEGMGDVLAAGAKAGADDEAQEMDAFLRWLVDDNFTFLGYRELELKEKNGKLLSINVVSGRGLGVLRDDAVQMFDGLRHAKGEMAEGILKYVRQNHVLSIMKTNAVSRVHRVVPMDAIFVRRFDDRGFVVSERLFVGLFTSKTYAQTPRAIPLVRRKVTNVVDRLNFMPKTHNGRNLMHIINTYPHDELFQVSEEDLYRNVLGILQLQERARVALFLRRDVFDRYVTYFVYVPRDIYSSALRQKIQKFLERAFKGKTLSWQTRIDDSLLARTFGSIRLSAESPHLDADRLEADVRELCRTWSGRLRDCLVGECGEAEGLRLLSLYGNAFPKTYRESVSPMDAVRDVLNLERMGESKALFVDLHERSDGRLSLKLLQAARPLRLSEMLPVIENMGLKIDHMGGPYQIGEEEESAVFAHEFVGRAARPSCVDFETSRPVFEETLARVSSGDAESDPFNGLSLRAGLAWREIVLLRSFARYLRQLRIPYSHEMIAEALLSHAEITQKLCALFFIKHAPSFKGNRASGMTEAEGAIQEALTKVSALEEDRIIRRYLNLVQASLRTNYFQADAEGAPKPYLSIKYDSHIVDFMPLPKPLYEIFVYSPCVEAVHLRGGKVARGGIRWSDRRDDFRNEILGLMKAQMVKNTVIVPVGSKGGFIVKQPPAEADKIQAEGIACYKTMMRGLLDITDNAKGSAVIPPKNVVRHDGDDPYLVVAADKGTAKFSDIANGISREYGFWLDDAFASGGSAGYDHKGMGITARGAWEAVKRHFRELGKDIQTQPFTCVGVGDMSGDVFGNGMLLSPKMLLLGAFDHRHVFCDPMPDAAKGLAERKRLFALPRSSWGDYNRQLISKGGGVFSRAEKAVKISSEMKKVFGISTDTLSPTELIRAMLKAEVELVYFGGIGTYVKASSESNGEVGDRANEALRIDGGELRAKVVGEGANLAMTQRGRVEYAQKGGRLNTDAIDNSAGVDTSDHEVNIKILLRRPIDRKTLTFAARDKLLASMTDDVGRLVLRDNYLQTQALSVLEAQSAELFPAQVRCMQFLERDGLLNRAVEFLPDDAGIAERERLGKGLTRSELAVLFAYSKLWLYEKILDSKLPDDSALQEGVVDYFPEAVRRSYAKDIAQHRLRREIAATVVTNDIINRVGTDVLLLIAGHGDVESVVRSYILTRNALGLPEVWSAIESLDNKVHASEQISMLVAVRVGLVKAMERLLVDRKALASLDASIKTYRKGFDVLSSWLLRAPEFIPEALASVTKSEGVPKTLIEKVTILPALVGALDLVGLAEKGKTGIDDLASIFFGLERRLELSELCHLAAQKAQTSWQREAVAKACEKLAQNHCRLTAGIAAKKAKGEKQPVIAWAVRNAEKLEPYDAMLAHGRASGAVDLALLLLANERLGEMAV